MQAVPSRLAGTSITLTTRSPHLFVLIVQIGKDITKVPFVTTKYFGDQLWTNLRFTFRQYERNERVRQINVGERPVEVRQTDITMGSHEQAPLTMSAGPLESPLRESCELLVAIDNEHRSPANFERFPNLSPPTARHRPLLIVQIEWHHPYPRRRRPLGQQMQQRRLAGSVWADNLSPKARIPKPLKELLFFGSGREMKGNGAWSRVTRGKRIAGHERSVVVGIGKVLGHDHAKNSYAKNSAWKLSMHKFCSYSFDFMAVFYWQQVLLPLAASLPPR